MVEDAHQPPSRVPWPPLVLLGCLLLAVASGAIAPLPWPDGVVRAVLTGIGAAVVAVAIAADVWSIGTLRRHRTTVLPHKVSDQLVTDGPFAFSRNPIYAANAALLVGIGLVAGNAWFILAAVLLVGLTTRLAIVPEERHLAQRFGAAYAAYRAQVRRWL